MFATFKTKKTILTLLLLVGCGDDTFNKDLDQVCHVHDAGYSHTVVFCGGREPENVEDVFVTCDVRKSRQEQFEGCIGDIDLMDLDPDCELQHICQTPWTENDQQ